MQINENSETLKNGSKAKLKQKELTHKLTSYVLTLIPVKYMCACVCACMCQKSAEPSVCCPSVKWHL